MEIASLLVELYGRIPPLARQAVADVDAELLNRSPSPGANTLAWLVWHPARVQDHYISEMTHVDQIWVDGDWAETFGLEPDPSNTGYGHSAEEMLAVHPASPEVLLRYLDIVHRRTEAMLMELTSDGLDVPVDRSWDPPVTLGVRLVSIADDGLQHMGQAAYVRGLLGIR